MKKINKFLLLLLTITSLLSCDKSNFEETNIVPTHVYQITDFKDSEPYYKLTIYDEINSLIVWSSSVNAKDNCKIIDLENNSSDSEYSFSFKTINEELVQQQNQDTNEMEDVVISKVITYEIYAVRSSSTVGIPASGSIKITDNDNVKKTYEIKVVEDYKYKEN